MFQRIKEKVSDFVMDIYLTKPKLFFVLLAIAVVVFVGVFNALFVPQ